MLSIINFSDDRPSKSISTIRSSPSDVEENENEDDEDQEDQKELSDEEEEEPPKKPKRKENKIKPKYKRGEEMNISKSNSFLDVGCFSLLIFILFN